MAFLKPILLALMVAYVAGQQCTPQDDSTLTVRGCDSDTVDLSCDSGNIEIVTARYGGRPGNTCRNKQTPNSPSCTVNNYTDVTAAVKTKCNGKANCSVLVYPKGAPDNGDLADVDQCLDNAKEAIINYKCTSDCPIAPRTLYGCDAETKTISCECGNVLVQSATYGGAESNYCINAKDTVKPPCTDPAKSVDVTAAVKAKCVNTARCSFIVSTSNGAVAGDLGTTDPCFDQAKQVKVTYGCGIAA